MLPAEGAESAHALRQECRRRTKRLEKSEKEGQTDRRWKAELRSSGGPSHSAESGF